MNLLLQRVQLDPDVTIGKLLVNGSFECWTCEDVVRPDGAPKVFGQTAIPYGSYDINVTFSPHFKCQLPLLLNVPGFEGVRIHPGNTPADTEGCLLVGQDRLAKSVGRSRVAFSLLFEKIQAALRNGETISLEISK
jgi:hypothetical protein